MKKVVFLGFMIGAGLTGCNPAIENFSETHKKITITPDYSDITIPSNIAPLNFHIGEKGDAYYVEVLAASDDKIRIRQKSPDIQFPLKKWHRILNKNKGSELQFAIFVRQNGNWVKFNPIKNRIAPETIDPYLAYRLINTQYTYSSSMKLSQRNLESFDEHLIFKNNSTNEGCLNCHSFSNYDPDKISIHFRHDHAGTLIKDGERLIKLSTKTPFTMSTFGYVGWNPNGRLVAYSVNVFNEYFTNSAHNLNEVTDQASDIVVYNVKTNMVTTSPKISTHDRENFPSWSPDGKWLYYVSAGRAGQDFHSRYYGMYSLVRITYDEESNSWGDPDTVFNAIREGKSITFPRVSPDGRYLLFTLIDYGYFSINHLESDLYLMDLNTREYKPLAINSPFNDSYHAWSSNGKWIVFSSKRYNNLYSSPHFAYFDDKGDFHKPFIMPQKDPLFYETYLDNFNIPEFIKGKVDLNPIQIRDLLYGEATQVKFDETIDVDALSGSTWLNAQKP